MKQKTQIFMIHGGTTFKNEKDYLNYLKNKKVSIEKKDYWSAEYLDKILGKKCDIIRPKMPLSEDAKYRDWKIVFEKYIPLMKNNIILIGVSLGGIFLAKYLSENKFPKKILSIYLVSPPFDDTCQEDDLVGGFKLKKDLSLIEKNSSRLTLLFCKNDPCVPVSHAKKYRNNLKRPKIIVYNHIEGHFSVSKLPEIVKMIKEDLKRLRKGLLQ